jgi:hypothetical protein
MSAYRNRFIYQLYPQLPFIGDYVVVHEQARELIQGGAEGEHYHLTSEEHSAVQVLTQEGTKVFEPIALHSELMFSSDGQVMLLWGGELE